MDRHSTARLCQCDDGRLLGPCCHWKGLNCCYVRAFTSSALADGGCCGNCLAAKCAVQNCTTLCGSCTPLNLISPMCEMCTCKTSTRSNHIRSRSLHKNTMKPKSSMHLLAYSPTLSLIHPCVHSLIHSCPS